MQTGYYLKPEMQRIQKLLDKPDLVDFLAKQASFDRNIDDEMD